MKIFGIIGSPITHSLSPKMHEAAYRKLNLSCSYKSYDVSAEKLGAFIADGRKRFAGLNVTVPHKVAVIEYLDELDESAKLIGAVNTIKFGNNLFLAARAIHVFLLFGFDPLLTLSDGSEHAIVCEIIFAGLILN